MIQIVEDVQGLLPDALGSRGVACGVMRVPEAVEADRLPVAEADLVEQVGRALAAGDGLGPPDRPWARRPLQSPEWVVDGPGLGY